MTKDYAEEARLYELAAEQGYAKPQYNLGVMYDNGEGVTQDYSEAVRWYTLAAEQGDTDAQNNLGVLYAKGEGVTQDDVLAHMWFALSIHSVKNTSRENREKLAKQMTPQQIAEAQKLATECKARNYKGCD